MFLTNLKSGSFFEIYMIFILTIIINLATLTLIILFSNMLKVSNIVLFKDPSVKENIKS